MVSNRTPAAERRLELARDPASPGEARHFVERLLREHQAPEAAVQNALLVSSELITNAYTHGQGRIELRVKVGDDRVRIEVVDEGRDQAPAVRQQHPDEFGGWGLRLVDHLTIQWGVFEGTTHVWADIALT